MGLVWESFPETVSSLFRRTEDSRRGVSGRVLLKGYGSGGKEGTSFNESVRRKVDR